jgi:2-polyprenyl-3-methyl-5-hydroxy-6-metoxy-1,4-benzoquinol methylase
VKTEDLLRAGYNKIALDYHQQRYLFDNRHEIDNFASLVCKNGMILDVGCGSGVPVAYTLSKKGFKVIGIDISEEMINLARKHVPKGVFLLQDMKSMDFDSNTFDGIISTYAIFHIPREQHLKLMKNFNTMMKKAGLLLVSMGSTEWEGKDKFHGAMMYWSHYDSQKNVDIVKKAGFIILKDQVIESRGEKHQWILAKKK